MSEYYKYIYIPTHTKGKHNHDRCWFNGMQRRWSKIIVDLVKQFDFVSTARLLVQFQSCAFIEECLSFELIVKLYKMHGIFVVFAELSTVQSAVECQFFEKLSNKRENKLKTGRICCRMGREMLKGNHYYMLTELQNNTKDTWSISWRGRNLQ